MAAPSDAEIKSALADILRDGELSQLTSRIVRGQLEVKFGVSFLARKKEIDKMMMDMITSQEKSTEGEDDKEEESGTSEVNGVKQEQDDEEDEESSEDDEPSPKKRKQYNKKSSESDEGSDDDGDDETHVLDDEELARKLHEDEKNKRSRKPPSGGSARRPVERRKPAKAKKPKESSGERRGFTKPLLLSPQLAEVVGEEKMARSDVVKKMWEIIKERKLEDPKNKRFTICDEQLQQVFGRKRILTFGMMKHLKRHFIEPAEIS
ncbi:upstream activation factor subunit UAF30-like isoform X2 [Stylophora pistillata]|uniref:upstream activation factor subunit UAF30-like isoform X2 n=1 Tax=Stylophora pistillata TaxID=50429 RepID=UPI000C04B272|nr:upstream activation factor subunit UAF30-like isoform X2 [Stylophora pistillata]